MFVRKRYSCKHKQWVIDKGSRAKDGELEALKIKMSFLLNESLFESIFQLLKRRERGRNGRREEKKSIRK